MKIQTRRTPTYLKCLAETRARADADAQRLQKIHAEVTEKLAEAEAERDSCDCLIRKFDHRLDPSLIAPIRAWKGRYGPRGALKRAMVKLLEKAWPETLTTMEIAWAVQIEFQIDFLTREESVEWLRNSVRGGLKSLVIAGVVERLHEVTNGLTNELGRWRFAPPAAPGLDALRAVAATAGVGVQQEVKRRGRPKSKPVVAAPLEA